MGSRNNNEVIAKQIMHRHNFDYNRRREWIIWGARHAQCTECSAEPYTACKNLSDIRHYGAHSRKIRDNRMPHNSRIDWSRILQGLYKRGYKDA